MQKLLNKMSKIRIVLLITTTVIACNSSDKNTVSGTATPHLLEDTTVFSASKEDSLALDTVNIQKPIGKLEQSIIDAGLVNIRTIDSSIVVNLKYSTNDNFLGNDIYGDLENAYLQKDVTEKLKMAQLFLKSKFPFYSLIVYDAARPRSIQRIMWDTLKISSNEKIKYLSNPKYGSLHNYGAAVDISIVDEKDIVLDMGTKYDCFDELAYPVKENQFLKEGKLSNEQIANRQLLRSVMQKAGFFNIQTEWWHFNSCYRNTAIERYKIIE